VITCTGLQRASYSTGCSKVLWTSLVVVKNRIRSITVLHKCHGWYGMV